MNGEVDGYSLVGMKRGREENDEENLEDTIRKGNVL